MKSFLCKDSALLPLYEQFGNRFVEYRRIWHLASQYKLETSFPLFLMFELTSSCNYKCKMCFRGNNKLFKQFHYQEKLDFQTYKRLIDEASDNQCPSVSLNNNNEPLLQKDLEDYIAYASQKGIMDIMINTNASLLTPSRSKSLIDSGLTRIMFSLDSTTVETYKAVRGRNNFREVRSNILEFINIRNRKKKSLPLVRMTFVRMSFNSHEEKAFHKFWQGKCDYVSSQEFLPPYPGGYKYLKPLNYLNHEPFRCISPWQRIIIQGDGSVLPCCQHYARDLTLGSIHKQTIKQIWLSGKMRRLRQGAKANQLPEGSICGKCKIAYEAR